MPPEVTTPGTGEFPTNLRVAVLGGTGPQGRGLARRFAAAGLDVIVGSDEDEKIRGREADLHLRLREMAQGIDHLHDIRVWNLEGQLLASSIDRGATDADAVAVPIPLPAPVTRPNGETDSDIVAP